MEVSCHKLSDYSNLHDRNRPVTQYPTFQICCLNPKLCLTTSTVYAMTIAVTSVVLLVSVYCLAWFAL